MESSSYVFFPLPDGWCFFYLVTTDWIFRRVCKTEFNQSINQTNHCPPTYNEQGASCLLSFYFVWCPCTAINVSVQYNGEFLPDTKLLALLLPSGNPIKCHEDFLSLQPTIPPKLFGISPPLTGGCSEGRDAVRFFFKYILYHENSYQKCRVFAAAFYAPFFHMFQRRRSAYSTRPYPKYSDRCVSPFVQD